VLRRDFENGIVLVNAPGARPMTLSLERGYAGDDGARRRRVTLGPAEGAVLRDDESAASARMRYVIGTRQSADSRRAA
jgi:hypothetical protein